MKPTAVERARFDAASRMTPLGGLGWVRENAHFAVGLLCVLFVGATALLAPLISPQDPTVQDLELRLLPPVWIEGGRQGFYVGTDQLGRDILSRIFYGGRVSLLVGVTATFLTGTFGTLLGLIAGYFSDSIGMIIMSIVDIQLALPFIILSLAVMATIGPGLGNVILLLVITQWVVFARVVRGLVLSLKEADFVLAARSTGATDIRIVLRHIFPNTLGPTLAVAIPRAGQMILAEAALSFLGLGTQPPTPTWGGMLSDARPYLHQAPWLAIFPGMAIMVTVSGINLLGDWCRVILDPRQRKR